ncbi:hypothetical protein NBRC10512_000993 [Rhodotorula toruloides]|uniref:RHTO0S17e03048g1_1 n=2 Tax=Rhodotorula toruloides TaxID=5286 RepID=A0A061BGB4_RHOTO|nr:uncharacterized protein RHTO_03434 [Rhodotorula toruloides NP11]EMS20515.1 hypothetical protein RHTO_03434 [Rhodotorula toruloides NP11]CDR48413.1 RHTO0S17e03048g1_1 [Rhodotorula toruloides]
MAYGASKKNKKQAAKKAAEPAKAPAAAAGTQEDDDEMPPLEEVVDATPKSSTGGAKADDGDDSDASMPPLTDEAGPPPSLRNPDFSHGKTESRLFNFDAFEGIEGAYKHLGMDPRLSDQAVRVQADKIMAGEVRLAFGSFSLSSLIHLFHRSQRASDRGGKDTSSRLAALLVIVCSRVPSLQAVQTPSTLNTLARTLRLLYLSEAQLHLTDIRLPLPPGAVVPSDVDIRCDDIALTQLSDERLAHDRTRDRLRQSQLQVEKATSATSAAKSKADKAEGEAKSLRKELGQVKSEMAEFKVEIKEGYAAKEKVEKERDELKDEVERLKKEVQASPAPSLVSSISSDKKDFVIQRLSKQVQELTKQVKQKNDENLKLMLQLGGMGLDDAAV